MPSAMSSLRWHLVAAPPVAVLLAGVVPVLVDPGSQPVFFGLSILLLASAAVVWPLLRTRPLAELTRLALPVARGETSTTALPGGSDEVGTIANAFRAFGERYHVLEEQFQTALTTVTSALTTVTRWEETAAAPILSTPKPEWALPLTTAFEELVRHVKTLRQQNELGRKILLEVPEAVLVSDLNGKLRFVNTAAERMFGQPRPAMLQSSVAALLTEPTVRRHKDGAAVPLLPWLQDQGGVGRVNGCCAGGRVLPLEFRAINPVMARQMKVQIIVVTDLTDRFRAEAEGRAAAREDTCRQLIEQFLRNSQRALHEVGTQVRVLTQEAKQMGQRDRLLPKFTLIREQTDSQQILCGTLDWLHRVLWGKLPTQVPAEFMAVESIQAVEARLAVQLRTRRNRLNVQGDGGWLFCDSEWLQAIVTGLVTHAASTREGASIEVRLSRRTGGSDDGGDAMELTLPDAGPALGDLMTKSLREPFAERPQPLALVGSPNEGGFPLGLLTAFRLVPHLGGSLELQNSPAGHLSLLLRLPSRLSEPVETIPEGEAELGLTGPVEETCAGWRLGFPVSP